MIDPKAANIRLISAGLILLYSISLVTYLQFTNLNLVLAFLFFILVLGAIAVVCLREWGRVLLIIGNIFLAVYFFVPYVRNYIFVLHIGYIIMSVIILLFFSQRSIRNFFLVPKSLNWKSVLIIDDDETLVRTVRPILISHGYSVLTANTGETGLQIVQTQKPDLVLLDVILPGIKGRDVCRKIKEDPATKKIPVVFLTAKFSEDDIKAEMAAGAESHLTKPVSIKQLVSTIDQFLR